MSGCDYASVVSWLGSMVSASSSINQAQNKQKKEKLKGGFILQVAPELPQTPKPNTLTSRERGGNAVAGAHHQSETVCGTMMGWEEADTE